GMERTELEMLALKRGGSIFPQHAQRLDRLIGHRAAVMEVYSERLELLFHPSAADSENDSPAREYIYGRDFLCGVDGMPLGQDQYSGREFDGFSHRRHIRERDKRVRNCDIVTAGHAAILAARIRQVFDGNRDVFHAPQRFETAALGGGR